MIGNKYSISVRTFNRHTRTHTFTYLFILFPTHPNSSFLHRSACLHAEYRTMDCFLRFNSHFD